MFNGGVHDEPAAFATSSISATAVPAFSVVFPAPSFTTYVRSCPQFEHGPRCCLDRFHAGSQQVSRRSVFNRSVWEHTSRRRKKRDARTQKDRRQGKEMAEHAAAAHWIGGAEPCGSIRAGRPEGIRIAVLAPKGIHDSSTMVRAQHHGAGAAVHLISTCMVRSVWCARAAGRDAEGRYAEHAEEHAGGSTTTTIATMIVLNRVNTREETTKKNKKASKCTK